MGPAGASVVLRTRDRSAGRRYEYRAAGGTLTIAATDAVAACVGLHHYLREQCGLAVHWDTTLPLPVRSLPDTPVRSGRPAVADGYYLNFCTFSYTMPYWDWADWEREIDWMALHGITMPLAVTGHEAAVHAVYSRLGLDDREIRRFLGGPGYLPFGFMGCVDGFAGPLPASWLSSHRELGRRILQRQRALGMTPVLPAFTGHVPRQLAPERVRSRLWQGFETYVIDPLDPLYRRIVAEFVHAQSEIFGTDHLYAADPFIEMAPVDTDPGYPAAVAAATIDGLRAADPQATWVLQAWPFSYQREFWTADRVAAFLDAAPDDGMMIADLWAEHDPQWKRLGRFAGKRWLWCALLNFGGRTDPIADLHAVPPAVDEALSGENPPAGIGLAMEGTRNNPVFFALIADHLWGRVGDLDEWLRGFVAQRYGCVPGIELLRAWRNLVQTVYNAADVRIFPEQFNGVLTAKPSYARIPHHLAELRAEVEGALWYPPATLTDAWRRMIASAEQDGSLVHGPFGRDLIDVAVAAMSRAADILYLDAVERSVRHRHADRPSVERFLRLFDDLDRLLSTRAEFTFQHWESQALAWSTCADDHAVLADNARRMLTVWGSAESPLLDDYAGRIWGGMVGGYYKSRWRLWADGLDAAISRPGSQDERLTAALRTHSELFIRDGCDPSPEPVGDLLAESRRLFQTYGDLVGTGFSRTNGRQERVQGRVSP
ncbi:alpha-N-acetylglucosaminidase [Phytoactinopolyspora halotolerans]|uniref:Alpha-N-acetylglucosaminidase n=2 Tax=Phytoactinopolyspora halotolerans TaxID=1981512 RepID=A0A6L9S8Y5_9ACTN|nr:alpha-N-acetylglucosaminidase [Phytoactinopolyspora halotolerans]